MKHHHIIWISLYKMYKSMIRVISLNKLNCFLSLLMNNSYQWRIQGRGPGGPAPFPLIFRPNLGPKGRKKCLCFNLPTKWQTLLRMKYVLCSVRKGNTNNMMEKKWQCEILHIAGLLNSENPIQIQLKHSRNMYCRRRWGQLTAKDLAKQGHAPPKHEFHSG